MRMVPVYGRAGVVAHAMVDDEDFARVEGYRWNLNSQNYVSCELPGRSRADRRRESLHRMIMDRQPGDGVLVDHRNRNPLDNQRRNLRLTDKTGNQSNILPRPGTSSRYRGVSWQKDKGPWTAYANIRGVRHRLGYFRDEDEAGAVVAAFRRSHMPTSEMDRAAA